MATDYLKKYGITVKPKRKAAAAAAKKANPAKRKGTSKPLRKSQITGKPPSKRLVARRKKNTVPGMFPNSIKPSHKAKIYKVQEKVADTWVNVCMFEGRGKTVPKRAVEYAKALHRQTKRLVRIVD